MEKLFINDQEVELNSQIKMTFQNFEIAELKNNTSYTSQFKIPKTFVNKKVLENYNTQKLQGVYTLNGQILMRGVVKVLKETKDSFSLALYEGKIDLKDLESKKIWDISDKNTILVNENLTGLRGYKTPYKISTLKILNEILSNLKADVNATDILEDPTLSSEIFYKNEKKNTEKKHSVKIRYLALTSINKNNNGYPIMSNNQKHMEYSSFNANDGYLEFTNKDITIIRGANKTRVDKHNLKFKIHKVIFHYKLYDSVLYTSRDSSEIDVTNEFTLPNSIDFARFNKPIGTIDFDTDSINVKFTKKIRLKWKGTNRYPRINSDWEESKLGSRSCFEILLKNADENELDYTTVTEDTSLESVIDNKSYLDILKEIMERYGIVTKVEDNKFIFKFIKDILNADYLDWSSKFVKYSSIATNTIYRQKNNIKYLNHTDTISTDLKTEDKKDLLKIDYNVAYQNSNKNPVTNTSTFVQPRPTARGQFHDSIREKNKEIEDYNFTNQNANLGAIINTSTHKEFHNYVKRIANESKKITAYFKLSLEDLKFDFLRPIGVKQLNGIFIVDKIEYSKNALSKVTLTKI